MNTAVAINGGDATAGWSGGSGQGLTMERELGGGDWLPCGWVMILRAVMIEVRMEVAGWW